MKTIILKYTDCDWVTSYCRCEDVAFDIADPGLNYFITFYNVVDGRTSKEIIDVPVDMELEDIHDFLLLKGEENVYVEKLYDAFRNYVEEQTDEYIAGDEAIFDLNVLAAGASEVLSDLGKRFIREIKESWIKKEK